MITITLSSDQYSDEVQENNSVSYEGEEASNLDGLNEEKESLDFVCLGDSIVRWLDLDSINPGSNNKLECMRGAKIEDIRGKLIDLNDQFNIKDMDVFKVY